MNNPPAPKIEKKGNLYIARHGRTIANAEKRFQTEDDVLDEQGRRDAETLKEQFKSVSLDYIVTGNLVRHIQTGEPISREKGITPIRINELREFDTGTLKCTVYPEGHYLYDFLFSEAGKRGVETLESAAERADYIKNLFLSEKYRCSNTLAITSSTIGIFIGLALEGIDWKRSDIH